VAEQLWPALALVLILEGLQPFIAPGLWRRVFAEMIQLHDGQVRFFGLCCLVAGLLLWWALT
jgi:hypothetical protein